MSIDSPKGSNSTQDNAQDADNKKLGEMVPMCRPRKTVHDMSPKWEYVSLTEKQNFFDYSDSVFGSVDELIQRLERLASNANPYYFRGVSKDTYKIVSFAQRRWREFRCRDCLAIKKSYMEYLQSLLKWMKCADGILPDCPGLCLSDHQVWGFLQHYGCPTPLIDFSRSYLVALHMAIRRLEPGQSRGISVYAFQEGGSQMQSGNDICDLDYILTGGTANIGSEVPISANEYAKHASFNEWNEVYGWVVREAYHFWCPKLKFGRMEKQTGLFLYSREETLPFEDLIRLKNDNCDDHGDPLGNTLHPFKCFDIPKQMVPEIKKLLEKEGISDDVLGLVPCELENRIKTELERFENDFLNDIHAIRSKKGKSTMTEREYNDLFKAVMTARSMIAAYLEFSGGTEDGTVSALAHHLTETMESLTKILLVDERKRPQDETKHTSCPMFNEIVKEMERVEILGKNLPEITFLKDRIPVAAIHADVSNAIRSFKCATQEFPTNNTNIPT